MVGKTITAINVGDTTEHNENQLTITCKDDKTKEAISLVITTKSFFAMPTRYK
jgi:hypothetical protein